MGLRRALTSLAAIAAVAAACAPPEPGWVRIDPDGITPSGTATISGDGRSVVTVRGSQLIRTEVATRVERAVTIPGDFFLTLATSYRGDAATILFLDPADGSVRTGHVDLVNGGLTTMADGNALLSGDGRTVASLACPPPFPTTPCTADVWTAATGVRRVPADIPADRGLLDASGEHLYVPVAGAGGGTEITRIDLASGAAATVATIPTAAGSYVAITSITPDDATLRISDWGAIDGATFEIDVATGTVSPVEGCGGALSPNLRYCATSPVSGSSSRLVVTDLDTGSSRTVAATSGELAAPQIFFGNAVSDDGLVAFTYRSPVDEDWPTYVA